MTENRNSLKETFHAFTEKITQPQQGTLSQNTSENFKSQQKWRGNLSGCLNRYCRNRGSYNNQGSNSNSTKITTKEDAGIILPEIFAREVIIEETITEGTFVEIFQTLTTDTLIFNKMIVKILERH